MGSGEHAAPPVLSCRDIEDIEWSIRFFDALLATGLRKSAYFAAFRFFTSELVDFATECLYRT